MLTVQILALIGTVAALAAPVVRALSRATKELAQALDDVSATTLAIAFGRIDRRTPSGERRRAMRQQQHE